MRPSAIVNFERLFVASLVLGAANLLLLGEPGAELPLIEIATLALPLVLALFASRGRSNAARWILSVLTVLGFPALIYVYLTGNGLDLGWVVSFLVAALQLGAVGLLFTKPASAWFAGAGQATD